jgi:spore coat polysaccharide biosynthesis protein SpsF
MTSLKIGIVTQARVGSTRLPAKALLPLGSESVLGMHLRRLRATNYNVYVATTFEERSNEIIDIASAQNVMTWQGSIDDVLSRYYTCAKHFSLDVIVRVTSDCPLISPELIREGVERFVSLDNWQNSYLSNTQIRSYPRGFDFEVFSFSQLESAYLNCLELRYREHVTPYLYMQAVDNNRIAFHHKDFDISRADWRITLDTPLDYELIRRLVDDFGADNLTYSELMSVLDKEPALKEINREVEQKKI